MTPHSRRYRGLALFLLTILAGGGCWVVNYALTVQLHRAKVFSGCALLTLLLLLTLFNARKKLPFLPLLKAATWMRLHIFAGLLSGFLFCLHLHGRIPQGILEATLAVLYVVVAASGFVGLALSRWLPARLTIHGENLIYERIPALRAAVHHQVEELVEQSLATTHSSTIADFYESRLRWYFARPRFLCAHLLGYRQSLFTLLEEVAALDRFLDASERNIMGQIVVLINTKDNLDFQLAGQRLLKLWLFVHIPVTYGLLLFALLHAVLAFTLS